MTLNWQTGGPIWLKNHVISCYKNKMTTDLTVLTATVIKFDKVKIGKVVMKFDIFLIA